VAPRRRPLPAVGFFTETPEPDAFSTPGNRGDSDRGWVRPEIGGGGGPKRPFVPAIPRRYYENPTEGGEPPDLHEVHQVVNHPGFQGAGRDVQIGLLRKQFTGTFEKFDDETVGAWIDQYEKPSDFIGSSPQAVGDYHPAKIVDLSDEPFGIPSASRVAGWRRNLLTEIGARNAVATESTKKFFGGPAVDVAATTIREAQGLLSAFNSEEVADPPTDPDEWETIQPRVATSMGGRGKPVAYADMGDPFQRPTLSQSLETLTWPVRKAFHEAVELTGLDDTHLLSTIASATALHRPGQRAGAPDPRSDVEIINDGMDAAARYMEDVGATYGEDNAEAIANAPKWMRPMLSLVQGVESAVLTIAGPLKGTGRLLSATKIKGAGHTTLAVFEGLRAKGASEDEWAGAVHGGVLQLGLRLSAALPRTLGTGAGAAMFGGPVWAAMMRGEVTLDKAIAELIIGGYFGWHGSHTGEQSRKFKEFTKLLDLQEAARSEIARKMKQMRPPPPKERRRLRAGGEGWGRWDRFEYDPDRPQTGRWVREKPEDPPPDARPEGKPRTEAEIQAANDAAVAKQIEREKAEGLDKFHDPPPKDDVLDAQQREHLETWINETQKGGMRGATRRSIDEFLQNVPGVMDKNLSWPEIDKLAVRWHKLQAENAAKAEKADERSDSTYIVTGHQKGKKHPIYREAATAEQARDIARELREEGATRTKVEGPDSEADLPGTTRKTPGTKLAWSSVGEWARSYPKDAKRQAAHVAAFPRDWIGASGPRELLQALDVLKAHPDGAAHAEAITQRMNEHQAEADQATRGDPEPAPPPDVDPSAPVLLDRTVHKTAKDKPFKTRNAAQAALTKLKKGAQGFTPDAKVVKVRGEPGWVVVEKGRGDWAGDRAEAERYQFEDSWDRAARELAGEGAEQARKAAAGEREPWQVIEDIKRASPNITDVDYVAAEQRLHELEKELHRTMLALNGFGHGGRAFFWGPKQTKGDESALPVNDATEGWVSLGKRNVITHDGVKYETELGFVEQELLTSSHNVEVGGPWTTQGGRHIEANESYPPWMQTRSGYNEGSLEVTIKRAQPENYQENESYRASGNPNQGPSIVLALREATGANDWWFFNMGGNRRDQYNQLRTEAQLQESAQRWAEAYGIDPVEIDHMARPVPVQLLRNQRPQSTKEASALSSALNRGGGGRDMTNREVGRELSARFTQEFEQALLDIADKIDQEPATTTGGRTQLEQAVMGSKAMREALRKIIPDDSVDVFFETDGRLKPYGIEALRNAIIDRVVGDDHLVDEIAELPDLYNRVAIMAPSILRGMRKSPNFFGDMVQQVLKSEIMRRQSERPEDTDLNMFLREPSMPGIDMPETAPSVLDARLGAIHRTLAPHQAGGDPLKLARHKWKRAVDILEEHESGVQDLFGGDMRDDMGRAFNQAFLSADVRPDLGDRPKAGPVQREDVKTDEWSAASAAQSFGSKGFTITGLGRKMGIVKGKRATPAEREQVREALADMAEAGVIKQAGKGRWKWDRSGVEASERPITPEPSRNERRNRFNEIGAETDDLGEVRRKIEAAENAEKSARVERDKDPEDAEGERPGQNYTGFRDLETRTRVSADLPPRVITRAQVIFKPFKFRGWTMNFGRMNAKAAQFSAEMLGFYQKGTGWTKVRDWWDFQVGFHEMGHQLLDHHPELGRAFGIESLGPESFRDPSLPAHIREMIDLSYRQSMPEEGFSEAVRLYFSNQAYVREKAPNFSRTFDEWISQRPKAERKMWKEVERDAHDYFEQTGEASILAQTGATHAPIWAAYNGSLDNFRAKYVDAFHGIAKLEMSTRGYLSDDGPFFMARASRGIPWMAEQITDRGHPVFTGKGIVFEGESLRSILAAALHTRPSLPTLSKFLSYVQARRAWSLASAERIETIDVVEFLNAEAVARDPEVIPKYARLMNGTRAAVQFGETRQEAVERVLKLYQIDPDKIAWGEEPNAERPISVGSAASRRDRPSGREVSEDQYQQMHADAIMTAREKLGEDASMDAVKDVARQILDRKIGGATVGISKEAMRQGMALKEEYQHFEDGYKALVKFNEHIADFAQDLGLISREQRLMWPYADYAISFSRIMEGPPGQGSRGASGTTPNTPISASNPIRRLTGGGRQFKDPLTRLYETPARMIHAAIENHVKVKVARQLLVAEDRDLKTKGGGLFGGEIKPGSENYEARVEDVRKAIMKAVKEDAERAGIEIPESFMREEWLPEAITMFAGGRPLIDNNVMAVFMKSPDGKVRPRYFEVHDKLLVEALQHFRKPELGNLAKFFNAQRRILQTSVTRGPDFLVGQLARDPITNFTLSRQSKDWLTTTIKGYYEAMKFVTPGLRSEIAERAVSNLGGGGLVSDQSLSPRRGVMAFGTGGAIREGSIVSKTANFLTWKSSKVPRGIDYRRGRAITKYAQRHNKGVSAGDRLAGMTPEPGSILRALDRAVAVTEMGPRLGEAIRAERAGKEGFELGKYYREASVDFSQQGYSGVAHGLMIAIPFLRAQVASWDRFYRALGPGQGLSRAAALAGRDDLAEAFRMSVADESMKTRTVAKIIGMMGFSMWNTAHNMGIEEYRNTDHQKKMLYNYFYVPVGRTGVGEVEYEMFRMPRPYDIGMFTAVGDLWLENMLESEDPVAFSHGMALLFSISTNFGIGIPPLFNAAFKILADKDPFTGRPVLGHRMSAASPRHQTKASTSETMRAYGEAMKDAPIVDWMKSPAMMESVMQSFMATIPGIVLGTLDDIFFDVPAKRPGERAGLRRVKPTRGINTQYQRDWFQYMEWLNKARVDRGIMTENRDREGLREHDDTVEGVVFRHRKRLSNTSKRIGKVDAEIRKFRQTMQKKGWSAERGRDEKEKLLRERERLYERGVRSIEPKVRAQQERENGR